MSASDILTEIENSIDSVPERELIKKLDRFFRAGGATSAEIKHYPLLNYFALKGKPLLVKDLLIRNPDKESIGGIFSNNTPLQTVTSQNLEEETVLAIVSDLLRSGAKVDSPSRQDRRPLLNAIQAGYTSVVEELLEYKPHFNKYEEPFGSALWLACFLGNVKIVELLLAAGADVNDSNLTTTTTCLKQVQRSKATFEPTTVTKTVPCQPVVHGWTTVGPSTSTVTETVYVEKTFWYTAAEEQITTITKKRPDGVSPLMIAASRGHCEVVALLLEKGANCTARDASGNLPLHHAVMGGKNACVKMIFDSLEKTDSYNTCELANNFHETPLQLALSLRRSELIEILLSSNRCKLTDREYAISIMHDDAVSLNYLLVFGNVQRAAAADDDEDDDGKMNNNNIEKISLKMLELAAKKKKIECLKIIIAEGGFAADEIDASTLTDDVDLKNLILQLVSDLKLVELIVKNEVVSDDEKGTEGVKKEEARAGSRRQRSE